MLNFKSALYYGLFNAVANLFVFLIFFLNVRSVNYYTTAYLFITVAWTLKCYSLRSNGAFILVGFVPCLFAGCVNYFYRELHLVQFLALIPGLVIQGILFSKWKPK